MRHVPDRGAGIPAGGPEADSRERRRLASSDAPPVSARNGFFNFIQTGKTKDN